MKYKIIVDKQSRLNPSSEKKEYEIDIEELRYKGNIRDSLIITSEEDYVMRRLSLSEYGVLSVLSQEIKQPLQNINVELFEGENFIYVQDMVGNLISARYIVKNEFTQTYPTRIEMSTAINQTAQDIMLEVSKKVDEEDFGTQLTLNSEALKMAWNQISQYLKLEGIKGKASLVIYDKNNNKLIVYDDSGQHFYDNDTAFGEIGVKKIKNQRYVAFSVPGDYNQTINDGMAWGMTTTSDGKFWPILFVKDFKMANKNAGDFSGQLILNYCDLVLSNGGLIGGNIKMKVDDIAKSIYFQDIQSGDVLLSIRSDGTFGDSAIDILNGIIRFYTNSYGTKSLKVGISNTDYCLLEDTGNMFCRYLHVGGNNTPGSIYTVGTITATGEIYSNTSTSDRRLKKNIKNVEIKALEKIKKIKLKQFDMKENGKHFDIGYIAQDLEKIDPNFVLKRKTNNDEKLKKYQYYINELPIIATLTKAIQEQQETIEELQKNKESQDIQIKKLMSRIEKLEQEVKANG